jgi:hypothetical protein
MEESFFYHHIHNGSEVHPASFLAERVTRARSYQLSLPSAESKSTSTPPLRLCRHRDKFTVLALAFKPQQRKNKRGKLTRSMITWKWVPALPSRVLSMGVGCVILLDLVFWNVNAEVAHEYKRWRVTVFYNEPFWPWYFASWTAVRPIWRQRVQKYVTKVAKNRTHSPSGSGFQWVDQGFT